ncbi:hypothetical protein [Sphingobium sp. Ant17]|uniref:hypothetical protein n=1 Tax=Sphingobium sp. Ant17 TaxID=1461752 RepID=UPI0005BC2741|nr:hypothetical protein [Sphingobium sp. Ant17]
MPRLTARERLAELETRQRKSSNEIDAARISVQSRYAAVVQDLSVETLTERKLRELRQLSIQRGGAAAIAALKPPLPPKMPGKKSKPPR